ncbi:MAG: helix-turn-helix transcriptional regulator [Oscillospiraceae bacterium]|nr:helix-turn-helix transcriptional regulator [Oscillospiraceae bacterium]
MDKRPYMTWEEVKAELNITPEQQLEIDLQEAIIEATIAARKKNKLTQRDLSKKSGIKQSAIARIEKCVNSPQVSTLIKLLYPLGFTIRVVPIDDANKI